MKSRVTAIFPYPTQANRFILDALETVCDLESRVIKTWGEVRQLLALPLDGLVVLDTELLDGLADPLKGLQDTGVSLDRFLLMETSDTSFHGSIDDVALIEILGQARGLIRREANLVQMSGMGIPREKVIPAIFDWSRLPVYDWSIGKKQCGAFFMGSLSHVNRWAWVAALAEHAPRHDLLIKLYAPVGGSLPTMPSFISDDPLVLRREPPSQDEYHREIWNRGVAICLRGIGELTARHMEGWSSGRLVISDDSISFLDHPLVKPVHGVNCLLCSCPDQMLYWFDRCAAEPALARQIAHAGQEMVRELACPARLGSILEPFLD